VLIKGEGREHGRARREGDLNRGEVWWAEVGCEIADDLWDEARRAVVLLSGGGAPELKAMMIVAPTKAGSRGFTREVDVGADEGLPWEGVLRVALPQPGRILCDWLVTLGREQLVRRAGILSSAKLNDLQQSLRLAQLDPARWAD
jgi:mRNA interferase MazF